MVDLARLVDGFDGMKNEYDNAQDKTNTELYNYIEKYGADLSCVRLDGSNNIIDDVAIYRQKMNFKGTVFGVAFTLNGSEYALLDPDYSSYANHVTLNISGDNIKMVCDAMVATGRSFKSY